MQRLRSRKNHCLIGQAFEPAERYEHTVLDPGISPSFGNPIKKRCNNSGSHSQPFLQPRLADGRMAGISPVDEGFSPRQVAFQPKAPWKYRWLDNSVYVRSPYNSGRRHEAAAGSQVGHGSAGNGSHGNRLVVYLTPRRSLLY